MTTIPATPPPLSLSLADGLAQGFEQNRKAGEAQRLAATKERLRILRLLADQAVAAGDPRAARSVAEEVRKLTGTLPDGPEAAPEVQAMLDQARTLLDHLRRHFGRDRKTADGLDRADAATAAAQGHVRVSV